MLTVVNSKRVEVLSQYTKMQEVMQFNTTIFLKLDLKALIRTNTWSKNRNTRSDTSNSSINSINSIGGRWLTLGIVENLIILIFINQGITMNKPRNAEFYLLSEFSTNMINPNTSKIIFISKERIAIFLASLKWSEIDTSTIEISSLSSLD